MTNVRAAVPKIPATSTTNHTSTTPDICCVFRSSCQRYLLTREELKRESPWQRADTGRYERSRFSPFQSTETAIHRCLLQFVEAEVWCNYIWQCVVVPVNVCPLTGAESSRLKYVKHATCPSDGKLICWATSPAIRATHFILSSTDVIERKNKAHIFASMCSRRTIYEAILL